MAGSKDPPERLRRRGPVILGLIGIALLGAEYIFVRTGYNPAGLPTGLERLFVFDIVGGIFVLGAFGWAYRARARQRDREPLP